MVIDGCSWNPRNLQGRVKAKDSTMNKRDKYISSCFSLKMRPRFDFMMTPIDRLYSNQSFNSHSQVQISPLPRGRQARFKAI
jgi:hypothetical protein